MSDIIMLVSVQKKLPKIGETLNLEREISGRKLAFKVKKITSLEWNNDNQLIVGLTGEEFFIGEED